jgi:hypothetical protein
MPSRVIRGEINSSRSLERVSMMADLAFRALLVVVDDYGRFDGRLYILRNAMFPTRREVTEAKLAKWLDELEREGCIRRYVVAGAPYVELPTWETHRGKGRRAESSKYPENISPRKSSEIPGDPRSERMVLSEGREARGESDPPPSAGTRNVERGKTPAPDDLSDEDKLALSVWCKAKHPELATRARMRELVDACLDWHRANGRSCSSWLAACRGWIRREARYSGGKPPRGGGAGSERRTETADETLRMLERRRRESQDACEAERGNGFVPIGNVLAIVDSIAGGKR